jgi:hypothetical protein
LQSGTTRSTNGERFADEAGVALVEAVTVNNTLRMLNLSGKLYGSRNERNTDSLGAQSYKAFTGMLCVNASLALELPPPDTAVRDERLREIHCTKRDQLQMG